jgi:hypothetical protein
MEGLKFKLGIYYVSFRHVEVERIRSMRICFKSSGYEPIRLIIDLREGDKPLYVIRSLDDEFWIPKLEDLERIRDLFSLILELAGRDVVATHECFMKILMEFKKDWITLEEFVKILYGDVKMNIPFFLSYIVFFNLPELKRNV